MLSIVIPAKNEQQNVKPLVNEIVAALRDVATFEILYIDDGSDDGTYAEAMDMQTETTPEMRPYKHSFSVGQSGAVRTGVSKAVGDLIVTLDADGQNNPADIPLLLEQALKLPQGSDFCVAGYRKQRKDTRWKRFQSRIANGVRRKLLGDDTPDTGCGLKIFPRKTFLALPYFDHIHRFLPALVKRIGGTIVVVEVSHRDRQFGESKYNMLGRLGVGLVDMLGVIWLQRRYKASIVVEDHD
ncbi:glycosyltransferase family 2 protein [Shewanella inventionis]|uniref:Dolichol-phosphate mannosyltransferase n=1 Tax=Shewanella inventionis TaxID=1738770 RepID=A0ABQ1JUI3_9GAMM|nr:glycosyltransferase family 2 protein [Shewanella inventionis]MCL1159925.1 glycosyltransferase family 2 protein [Shewanella inventionis]UAL43942.1 glycosyltransferase family 2 protein [Shewanella inventionis]GGB74877.1 dolichol-phosphate mannosyltransferase [Shewanella inventionis]